MSILFQADVGADPNRSQSCLIVCLSRAFGGADVRVIQTARWCEAHGHPYLVAALSGSQLHRDLEKEGMNVEPLRRKRGDPRLILDLARLARGRAVVDLHNMQSQIWGALAAVFARVPNRVATVHSVYRATHPDLPRKQIHEGALRLCNWAGFRFIVVSTSVEAYLKDDIYIPARRVTLSRNGIDPLTETPVACNLRAEAGWPEDTFIIGAITRLDVIKGHRFLFEALLQLSEENRARARLFIVGKGPDEAALRAEVARHGLEHIIHFAGFRIDIPCILSGLDLMCQPSISEGLPYSILEACRQGVPVLSSDLPGIAAVLEHDRTAFFAPPASVEAITRLLDLLIPDEPRRRRVADAARKLVETEFSVDTMIESTMRAYSGEA
ncbi:hypothetical protein C1J03_15425 [Sulfitobacter sp. SK012]|uniref:glycosyltransferase family 4 protein n=1 Tax=Sulfitobacter sp. SK012 TaxID=1389005 RepID=UPI000E0A388C|nr:glycosyltransferase family 4 protein [Sulfitobacter sp. SK012]AXI47277.1 hypothetical protein C1J03_15425 [Sulfitobacter sp. SK012]